MSHHFKSNAPESVAGDFSLSSSEPAAINSLSREVPGIDQFSKLLSDLGFSREKNNHAPTLDHAYGFRQPDRVLVDRIFVRNASENFVRLFTDDIYWIKADGNYCEIVCKGKAYTVCLNLKQFEERLGLSQFIRVHRSYLINLKHVSEFGECSIFINNEPIPIGRSHRDAFAKQLIRF